MRGHYIRDARRMLGNVSASVLSEDRQRRIEDRNQRANEIKQAAGDGPQIIASPDTVTFAEDRAAIVRYVAMLEFRASLDFDGLERLAEYHPALIGLTEDEVRAVIAEELS